MGAFWIRQATESMWRIGAGATLNATNLINANDEAFALAA